MHFSKNYLSFVMMQKRQKKTRTDILIIRLRLFRFCFITIRGSMSSFLTWFFLFFRWFRHITEASNAYKARENRRSYRGPGLGSDSPLSSHNGLVDSVSKSDVVSADSLDLPGDTQGQPAGRSQSFHEHSISNMEPHPERQPSSPPEDLADQDTFASKTGLRS